MPSTNPEPASGSAADAAWRTLTWDDLQAWCGTGSLDRGRTYQRSGRVQQLARTADGVLLAWVQGGERYATQVALTTADEESGVPLVSRCNCPVGFNGCKHAVAVAVEYLEALKNARAVPLATANDPRRALSETPGRAAQSDDEHEGDDETEEFAEDEVSDEDGAAETTYAVRRERTGARPRRPEAKPARTARKSQVDVRAWLEGLPAADLVGCLLELAKRYPKIAAELKDRAALAQGKFSELIRQARKEIDRLTREPAWQNSWTGEGHLPDYSRLAARFEQLLAGGQADALLDLGEHLFEAGQRQVEQSRDEGETAAGINRCLDIVFRAVLAASRPDHEKLLYVIDLLLDCAYELGEGVDLVLDKDWPAATWSLVADELAQRVEQAHAAQENEGYGSYRHTGLTHWLIQSLEHAGRTEEILPLCEAEARRSGSYERLVQRLLAAGRTEEAERWAREGIERVGAKWPGIAANLQEQLRKLAEQRGDWLTVASFRATEFWLRPSLHSLNLLQQAADRAGCGPEVRAAALRFLETGLCPEAATPKASKSAAKGSRAGKPAAKSAKGSSQPWPLPPLSCPIPAPTTQYAPLPPRPHHDLLLQLAIEEKRPADVLHWFDQLQKVRGGFGGWAGVSDQSLCVAEAVAATHPQRALDIYRDTIERYIDQTSPSAYEAALPSLRKMRAVLQQQGREADWSAYVRKLREQHHRKRKLLETLDRLDARPIVNS